MSDNAYSNRRVEQRRRDALRQLDEKRMVTRWARIMSIGAFLLALAVVTGWVFAIALLAGGGLVGAIVGLSILSIGGCAAVGISLTVLFDAQKALRKAQYAYEDAVLESGL